MTKLHDIFILHDLKYKIIFNCNKALLNTSLFYTSNHRSLISVELYRLNRIIQFSKTVGDNKIKYENN